MDISDCPVRNRLRWLGLALLLIGAACAGNSGDARTAVGSDSPPATEPHATAAEAGGACTPLADLPGGDVADAPVQDRDFPWDRSGPAVMEGFDFSLVISGGPPPDGIRPIDAPCFDDVTAAGEWLEDGGCGDAKSIHTQEVSAPGATETRMKPALFCRDAGI